MTAPILTREAALDFFATLYRGEHHLPSEMRNDGRGVWSVGHFGGVATFDYDELTRLVFLAHDRCVRAWILAAQPRHVRIFITARERGAGDMSTDHPTIDQALAKFRERDDAPWWRELEKRGAT